MWGVRLPWGFTRLAMQCGPHRISHLLVDSPSGRVNWKTRPLVLCEVVPNELSPPSLTLLTSTLCCFRKCKAGRWALRGKLLCTLCRATFSVSHYCYYFSSITIAYCSVKGITKLRSCSPNLNTKEEFCNLTCSG